MFLFISIGTILMLTGAVILIHNGIISRYNLVKQAWADIVVQERKKERIIPKVLDLLAEHKVFEQSLLKEVTELRSALATIKDSSDINTELLQSVHNASSSLMKGFTATFEAYPDLKSSTLYSQVMNEISEQEDNVAASIIIFNSNVQQFNTTISIFPHVLVNNTITNKSRINEFKDKAESNFEYSPNV